MVTFRKDLAGFESYKVDRTATHNLGDNENRLIDWSDLLAEAVQQTPVTDLLYYGDNKYTQILEKFAAYVGVKPSQVVQGVGSDQMIHTIVSTFLTANDVFLTVSPDFFMYAVFSQVHGASVETYSLDWEDGRPVFLAEKVLDYANEVGAKVLMLSNPNNPASVAFDTVEVEKVVANFPGLVVIDEAYIDYSDISSFIGKIEQYDNLIVLRTMSKAFGLAGLRLGFAICCERLAFELDKVLAPYSMPNLVTRVGAVALGHTDKVKQSVAETKQIRADFIQFLQEQPDLHVLPSQTNFVTFTAPYAKEIYEIGLASDFNFKYYPEGVLANYIRMGIGRADEMAKMKDLIGKIAQENQ